MSGKVIAALSIFYIGGLLMIGGAVWSYLDEHSGPEVQAKIIDCYSTRGAGKYDNTYCTGRWTLNNHTVTADVFNGKLSDEGKTLTVRVHGNHASKPELWVSIGLAIFGTVILAFGVWLTARMRRQGAAGPDDSTAPSPA